MTEYTVSFVMKLSSAISRKDLADYISSELKAAGGCRPTDDPLFGGIETKALRIRAITKAQKNA